jgi:hypothetical protein
MFGCDSTLAEKDLATANSTGEIAGFGPDWMCADFGKPGHDYPSCKTCWNNFEKRMENYQKEQLNELL